MCPFTFLLQYLVYLFIYFFYCFQKRSLILKNTSAKPSIPLGLSMVSRASCITGVRFSARAKPTIVAKKEGVSSIKCSLLVVKTDAIQGELFNPLHHGIGDYVLLTAPYALKMTLTWRHCLTVTSFFSW